MTRTCVSLAVILLTLSISFSKDLDSFDTLLGSLWKDSSSLTGPDSLRIHAKVEKWFLDSLQKGKVTTAEIFVQKFSKIWQIGKGVDTVQSGIKLFRYQLDPRIFSEIKPEIVISQCGAIACGPNIGYLMLNKMVRKRLPCGFGEDKTDLWFIHSAGNQMCARITFRFDKKKYITSSEELPLDKQHQRDHLKMFPFLLDD
jgi:hypothetical protein